MRNTLRYTVNSQSVNRGPANGLPLLVTPHVNRDCSTSTRNPWYAAYHGRREKITLTRESARNGGRTTLSAHTYCFVYHPVSWHEKCLAHSNAFNSKKMAGGLRGVSPRRGRPRRLTLRRRSREPPRGCSPALPGTRKLDRRWTRT